MLCAVLYSFLPAVVEGKRSPGLTAIWLARNRFAVLDKTHQVSVMSEGTHVNKSKQGKANRGTQAVSYFQRKKLNCPERDSNLRSLDYMADALTNYYATKAAQQA